MNIFTKIILVLAISNNAFAANLSQSDSNGLNGAMVKIPAGTFVMGCNRCPMEDSRPEHRVTMSAFEIDKYPVTNGDFNKFIDATHYVTLAEQQPKSEDYPGVPVEKLKPGSAVVSADKVDKNNPYSWWIYKENINWRHPESADSKPSFDVLENHPVVHVSFGDASEYCKWAGKVLPTEAQFEYAARGGLKRKLFVWGDKIRPAGKWMANTWQASFPKNNSSDDGYEKTSPVDAFPANGYGLHDMSGNVWNWTNDWYRPDTYVGRDKLNTPVKNPVGPKSSLDPSEPGVSKRVTKGGSFLCSDEYCVRYLVGSRGRADEMSTASNLGFRCVRNL